MTGMSGELREGDYLEGRYKILARIGEGGMGVVYKAQHVLLKRPCAVKVLHPSEAEDERMIARFKIEAQSAANIRHPNIVEVMDFGITPDNLPFFVMEYLVGESLADRLAKVKRMSQSMAVDICDQILCGLASAHRGGIIHRDLKPDNIFLAKVDNTREVVKILDFGISKVLAGTTSRPPPPISSEHKQLTRQGTVLGTPGYMAPETVFGLGDVDARADLFSVAVILFEMLTGRKPFQGRDAREIMIATTTKAVPKPSLLRPDISEPMERLLLTGLSKEARDRFASAEEFLSTLTAAAVGRTPAAARIVRTEVGVPSMPPPAAAAVAPTVKADEKPEWLAERGTAPIELATRPRAISAPNAAPAPNLRSRVAETPRRRRISIGVSPSWIVFIGAVGALGYYYFVREDPMLIASSRDPIDERIAASQRSGPEEAQPGDPSADTGQAASPDAVPSMVTIWIDADPAEATVLWSGAEMADRPLIVGGSRKAVEVVFRAPGYEEELRMVTPDKEQTVRVRLKKKAEASPSKPKRGKR